ncbi:MAG TPA: aldehyde dehydrogenase family protein [Solirubrobacterales bacterium]|nr:aldehyde dehydrogenase family protein [Solirubrobacterales bacterium]
MSSPGRFVQLVDGEVSEPTENLGRVLENPSDGTELGPQKASSEESVERALAAAESAWQEGSWSDLPAAERIATLERFAAALELRAEEIARFDAIDSGVPIATMRLFAGALGDSVRGAAQEVAAAGETRPLASNGRRVEVLRLPWGPAVLLTPWNAPSGAAVGKLAASLAAGCPTILKPSEWAPSFAQAFAEAALEAGFPPGALQIVHGDAGVASRLVADSRVRAIALTGSQAAGRAVAAVAAARMAALQLELGGSNAAVVAADADVEATARALGDGAAKLNGQWCEAPRRVLVAAELHDDLREALVADLSARRVGAAEDEEAEIGPLAHRAHFEKVREQAAGLGGEATPTAAVPDAPGFFFSPTIVTGATPEAAAAEIFGPVLTLHPVADDREAVAIANANGDGLAGYVFSSDPERAFEIGRRLHAGEIRIGGTNLVDLAPGSTQSFWGTSGFGAHGNREVLEAFRGSRIVGEEDPALPF